MSRDEQLNRDSQHPELREYVVPAANTKHDVLANFAAALDFPSYFGHNYDALADCLQDFAAQLSEPATVVWQVSGEFAGQHGYRVIKEILDSARHAAPRAGTTRGTGDAGRLLTVRIQKLP